LQVLNLRFVVDELCDVLCQIALSCCAWLGGFSHQLLLLEQDHGLLNAIPDFVPDYARYLFHLLSHIGHYSVVLLNLGLRLSFELLKGLILATRSEFSGVLQNLVLQREKAAVIFKFPYYFLELNLISRVLSHLLLYQSYWRHYLIVEGLEIIDVSKSFELVFELCEF
jgi:hypothetical protein